MTRTTHRSILSAAVVSLVLLVSACGSSGSDAGTDEKPTTTEAGEGSTTEAEDTSTTAAEFEPDPEAQARAESVDVTVSDFVDGWEATPAEDPDADNPLNECDPALADRSAQIGRHATDDFSIGSLDDGTGTQFTARTVVFEDEAAAQAALAPFEDPDVIACIDETLQEAFASSGADVTVEGELEVDGTDLDVDESYSLSATYTVSAPDGTSLDVNLGVLVLRVGDIGTNVIVQTVDPEFDVQSLPIDALVERLNEA